MHIFISKELIVTVNICLMILNICFMIEHTQVQLLIWMSRKPTKPLDISIIVSHISEKPLENLFSIYILYSVCHNDMVQDDKCNLGKSCEKLLPLYGCINT